MIKTYIIGSGYLSNELHKRISNSIIITAKDFLKEIEFLNIVNRKINLIINSFYSSRKLNNLYSYKTLVEKSLYEIAEIFDHINPKIINKIIYTSSSSVYGSINDKIKLLDKNNRYLYSSTKLLSEMIVKNFSNK